MNTERPEFSDKFIESVRLAVLKFLAFGSDLGESQTNFWEGPWNGQGTKNIANGYPFAVLAIPNSGGIWAFVFASIFMVYVQFPRLVNVL